MADPTEIDVVEEGGTVVFVGANPDGNVFENDGLVHLIANNSSGDPRVMTVESVRDCDALHGQMVGALIDFEHTIADGDSFFSTAFSPHFYTGSNGMATVRFDDASGVTLMAFRIRRAR